jgi:hypothetical protein
MNQGLMQHNSTEARRHVPWKQQSDNMEVGMQLGKDDEVVVVSPASQASKWGRHLLSKCCIITKLMFSLLEACVYKHDSIMNMA